MANIFNFFQSAILMALLATNYIHLCKETLWLFANIVNCESVIVQVAIVHQQFYVILSRIKKKLFK